VYYKALLSNTQFDRTIKQTLHDNKFSGLDFDNCLLMSFTISKTLANTFQEHVEALCNRGIGDRKRLQDIIEVIKKGKVIDGYTQHGIDRNNAWFNIYKQGQELLAQEAMEQLCPSCSDKEFAQINDIVSNDLPKRISKLSDPEIQYKMLQQSKVAENTFRPIFDSLYRNIQY